MSSVLKISIITFIASFSQGCNCRSEKSKAEHRFTTQICDKKLYVENYMIFGSGAFGGDIVSNYLTDSFNFRIFIGAYDNGHQFYSYVCKSDSIYIYKGDDDSVKNRILSTKIYSLQNLKKTGKFE